MWESGGASGADMLCVCVCVCVCVFLRRVAGSGLIFKRCLVWFGVCNSRDISLLAVLCAGEMRVGWLKKRSSNFHSGCFVKSWTFAAGIIA
jgi:hypothetical protein